MPQAGVKQLCQQGKRRRVGGNPHRALEAGEAVPGGSEKQCRSVPGPCASTVGTHRQTPAPSSVPSADGWERGMGVEESPPAAHPRPDFPVPAQG